MLLNKSFSIFRKKKERHLRESATHLISTISHQDSEYSVLNDFLCTTHVHVKQSDLKGVTHIRASVAGGNETPGSIEISDIPLNTIHVNSISTPYINHTKGRPLPEIHSVSTFSTFSPSGTMEAKNEGPEQEKTETKPLSTTSNNSEPTIQEEPTQESAKTDFHPGSNTPSTRNSSIPVETITTKANIATSTFITHHQAVSISKTRERSLTNTVLQAPSNVPLINGCYYSDAGTSTSSIQLTPTSQKRNRTVISVNGSTIMGSDDDMRWHQWSDQDWLDTTNTQIYSAVARSSDSLPGALPASEGNSNEPSIVIMPSYARQLLKTQAGIDQLKVHQARMINMVFNTGQTYYNQYP